MTAPEDTLAGRDTGRTRPGRPIPPWTRASAPTRWCASWGAAVGAVYLARRADQQYEKLVAIKVVQAGHETDEMLRRFRRERQILAGLAHPNIATLLDGGTTANGLPYFVMDYVEGEPIDQYCTRRGLAVGERACACSSRCAPRWPTPTATSSSTGTSSPPTSS